ncbi:MAG: lytic transglycosylase domain-containing protein [Rhizomicrobium sp.]
MASVTVLALSIYCDGAQAGVPPAAPVVAPNSYSTFIAEASQRFGIPGSWLRAVMTVESAGNPHAVSPKGAIGLMQLMPDTWSALRIQYHLGNDPFDPHDNILGGAAYLRELFDRFGASSFLAAYNAGPKRFQDYLAGLRPLRDETKRYVSTLAQMLPDLQIGSALPPLRVPSDWRAASLFTTSATTASSSINAQSPTASENTTATKNFALSPKSNGLFVPVRMSDQR